MDELALTVRCARPEDAADLERIYIESWQDTYPGIVSSSLLGAMSFKGHVQRWQNTIRGVERKRGAVLVAEDGRHGAGSDRHSLALKQLSRLSSPRHRYATEDWRIGEMPGWLWGFGW